MLDRGYLKLNKTFVNHKSSFILGLMMIFWTLYEGIISYITPILITDHGFSNTQMGLLYSTSSLFGVLFDFLFMIFVKNTHYRRIILIAFIICFAYPFVLWSASVISLFVLCMAIWGIYSDLMGFGISDFSGRIKNYVYNAKSLSIISTLKSVGYIIAPLITTLLLTASISPKYYAIFFYYVHLSCFLCFC